MRSLHVLRQYAVLLGAGVAAGVILAFWWLYQPSLNPSDPLLTPRPAGRYSVSVDAVIDTANFGIGRSDTDAYRLALMAPTYAQLMTSQPVLEQAQAILKRPITEQVSATAPNTVPIVHVVVEGPRPSQLASVAAAVVTATRDYVDSGQAANSVPKDVRLTVRGMGAPSTPEFHSARNAEIGLLLFCLPIGVTLALAFRLEKTSAGKAEDEPSSGENDPASDPAERESEYAEAGVSRESAEA